MFVLIHFLPGGNSDVEAVSGQRQRASCVRVVGARRIVGFVEVDQHAVTFGGFGGQEACSSIGLFAAGYAVVQPVNSDGVNAQFKEVVLAPIRWYPRIQIR
jgi:hypothetical protein